MLKGKSFRDIVTSDRNKDETQSKCTRFTTR